MSTVDLSVGNFENWEFSFPPAEILTATSGWEGGQFAHEPSEAGAAPENVNQLRDPYVFEDSDGSLYLLYTGSGEDAIGIAALNSGGGNSPDNSQDSETFSPVEDAYTRGGRSEDDNFGREDTLDVKQGNNENVFRRAYLNFRIDNPQDVDSAVLRLYATQSDDRVDLTLRMTENGWDEDSITWDNAPPDGSVIDTVRMGPADAYYEWDVSSLVGGNDENVSFVLYDEGADNRTIRFSSSEGSNPPELRVSYD